MKRPKSIPTEKQAHKLRVLAGGAVALAPGRRDWGPLLRRGWVEPVSEDDGSQFLPPLTITVEGLEAYVAAMRFDGLPKIEWGKKGSGREKPPQLDEHPHITKLKQERDEAREKAREAETARYQAESRLRRIKYAVEGFDG